MKELHDATDPARKQLLFVAYCFPPNAEAGTHRSFRFVKHLTKLGWKVVVLTADPRGYLPGTPVDSQSFSALSQDVEVIRTPVLRGLSMAIRFRNFFRKSLSSKTKITPPPGPSKKNPRQTPSRFQSFKDLISTSLSIPDRHIGWLWGSLITGHRSLRGRSFDVIYSSAPPWTSHLIAYTLSKMIHVPWVADFRDPWARNPWKGNRNRVHKYMDEFLERAVINRAGFAILNTEWAREEYRIFYKEMPPEKFQLIPNGYDPDDFERIEKAASSGENGFNLVHAGSIYGGRNPAPLLEAWSLFTQDLSSDKSQSLLSLVGIEGHQKDEIEALLSRWELEDYVKLIPRVSHKAALDMMASADLLLILQGGTSLCVPSKLFEYMALNKPILGLAPPGATADILHHYPLGRVVNPENPVHILDGIKTFFDGINNIHPEKDLREFVDRYKAFFLTKKLSKLLYRSIEQRKP